MTIKKYSFAQLHLTPRFLIYGVLLLLTAAIAALACGWSLWTDHSVRFNGMRTGRGFYRLPPLPIMYDPKTGKELTVAQATEELYNDEQGHEPEGSAMSSESFPDPEAVWHDAQSAALQGDLANSQKLLKKYLNLTNVVSDIQERRNSAYDILDAMTALKRGSKAESVREYISARYAFFNSAESNLDEIVNHTTADKNLSDNWEYLKAAIMHLRSKDEKAPALRAFKNFLKTFPNSEKREAATYMVAKLTMQSSHSFENPACGVEFATKEDEQLYKSKVEPIEKCRDEAWTAALSEFKRIEARFPNGRYRNDSRGWLAYLYRRGGMRAEALAEYYRLLGNPSEIYWRLEAKKSLQVIGQQYSDVILDKVEQMIEDEPDAAMAYAYHRIYNQAVDLTDQKVDPWIYSSSTPWEEREKEKNTVIEANKDGRHELERISSFATAMIKRYPKAHIGGGFVLRVAEAQFERRNDKEALALSNKALRMGVGGELRAQGLWVKGSVEHLENNFVDARKTFAQLVKEFPGSELTEGARRLMAMTAEDQDNLESALDEYLALNYKEDVAYFVDVLMPTDRLAKFVASHTTSSKYDYLLYALAIRYMRDMRWNDARATYRLIKTQPGMSVDMTSDDQTIQFAKEPLWSEKTHIVKDSWVGQDLKAIDDLSRLEQAVKLAEGNEAKAEAMYQFASYQFDASSLLFYNPAAWDGERYWLLSTLAGNNLMRLPNESQILFEYFQHHDRLARAIPLYLEIVDKYPNTKAAKDALYSAAVAHERLSESNPYWREIYGRDLFAGPRMVTYEDVKRVYPKYQLPRGTSGWEASTRTVNGGPGWAPKPKPLPHVSRQEKVMRKLKGWFSEYAPEITKKSWDTVTTKVAAARQNSINGTLNYLYLVFGGFLLLLAFRIWLSVCRDSSVILSPVTHETDSDPVEKT